MNCSTSFGNVSPCVIAQRLYGVLDGLAMLECGMIYSAENQAEKAFPGNGRVPDYEGFKVLQ